ncbi:MAG: transketolase [Clostridia bacterium]
MEKILLERKSNYIRKRIVDLVYNSQTGHIGGSLSSIDVIVALYYHLMNIDPKDPENSERDRFVLSKGHCVEGYYCTLADRGFFDNEELRTFSAFGTRLIGHPNREIPGVEMNTGALGHGLACACGMALSAKLNGQSYRVYTLMGDGELAEGSIWEAAMFASNYSLDNLYAMIDRNRLQISGPTERTMKLEPLKAKWEAFGFYVLEVDGNDMPQIIDAFEKLYAVKGKPKLLLLDTTKGKGVSYMENKAEWHHGELTKEQWEQAKTDLEQKEKEIV